MNVQYKTNSIDIFGTLAKTTAYHTIRKIKWMAITITSNKLLPLPMPASTTNDEDENDDDDNNDLLLMYAADVLH